MNFARVLPLALLAAAMQVHADAPAAADVARQAEALLAGHVPDARGPGIALLVARGDEVLFRGARGLANVELGVPLRADHVFRIGSVTKQFAAAALLKLVDDGKVALDDPLSKFLPDYPNGEHITVAQLLNHTSGIQSYTGIPGYMDQDVRRDLSTSELIAVFKDKPAEFAPGERWNYNNSGYVLVGAVIEKASGMAWDRWLEQSLLMQAGLKQTRSGASRSVIPMHAGGYSIDGEGNVSTAAPLSMTQPHAAGALVSTVDDLWRWSRALHGGRLLSAESYRRMTTPEGAADQPMFRYGYGLQAVTVRGRRGYEHGGGIFGFISDLLHLPEQQVTVAVLRNADGNGGDAVNAIARHMAAVALGDPYPERKPVDVPPAELRKLEGVYRLDESTTRTLRVVDGKLTSQRSGGAPFELTPIGDDTFLFENSFTSLKIERDASGTPTAVRMFPEGEGEGELWQRTDESVVERKTMELPRATLERFVGDYAAEQVSFKIFFDDNGQLRVQVPGQPAFILLAESATKLFITEVDARFEFEPGDGPASAATLIQGSTRIVAERRAD